MKWVLPLSRVETHHQPIVGGKCFALAEMARAGIRVPDTVCVTADAYERYVAATGLRERILEVVSHTPARREQSIAPGEEGVRLERLPDHRAARPPLKEHEVRSVFGQVQQLENLFGAPQDVEWTWEGDDLVVLQSRPITTLGTGGQDDERRWYLSLRRSFENLRALRDKIEGELIPGMVEEADELAAQAVAKLSDRDLAAEIERRRAIHEDWVDVYWDEFIPFAHGIRLFGQVYNDALRPDDPYEFMDLLAATEMASLERNQALEQMAALVRANPQLAEKLRAHKLAGIDEGFRGLMDGFVERFGDLSCAITGGSRCRQAPDALIRILLEMAAHPPTDTRLTSRDVQSLRADYLAQFEGEERAQAEELLDLARASYRLRDDDNIYLGRIEAEVLAAANEGKRRLIRQGLESVDSFGADDVVSGINFLALTLSFIVATFVVASLGLGMAFVIWVALSLTPTPRCETRVTCNPRSPAALSTTRDPQAHGGRPSRG